MSEQYWVGGFFIDLSRNQITQNKQSQTLAPKALSVLTYLAENHGRVVSHDELLTHVWQGTIVSPNTLQRSIAQLRKALGDEGKVYIKTHAKQGYSLECDVRWQELNNSDSNAEQAQINTVVAQEFAAAEDGKVDTTVPDVDYSSPDNILASSNFFTRNGLFIAVAVILVILGLMLVIPKPPPSLVIEELRLLTSTDNRELASIYSPDGQYVVFHRYSDEFCINNIWAKNTRTQDEVQLTQNLDSYGSHSFSKDGKQLAFIQKGDCNEPELPLVQKKCFKLMTLDFNRALNAPQSPTELMECIHSQIKAPKWLNNNHIALLKKSSERWKLISYSLEEDTSRVLYSLDDGNIIDYDYSVSDDLIALTTVRNDGLYYIEVLKSDGQLLSSYRIQYPEQIAHFRFIYPNFSALEEQLIFSTGRQLFTLSYRGEVTKISLPIDEPMGSPVFHPQGDRMLVIKGHYDSDIVSMPMASVSQKQAQEQQNDGAQNYSTIARSTLGEDSAMFQPNGELIAFQSERSGEEQIWITDGNGSQQLSDFPMDTDIYGMDWAQDGSSILVNVTHELIQVFLDGTQQAFNFEYRVERLLQWNSDDQTALALMRIKGVSKLSELDLATSQVRIINDKRINWALKTDSGQLIYTDHLDRFWKPGPAEDQRIAVLDGQGSDKRFLINNKVIFGINEDSQFWSYSLDDGTFTLIGELPNKVDHITDLNATDILMAIRVSGRKEVAEILLGE